MKKIIILLFIVSIGYIFLNKNEEIIIPNKAIRFRVIANSNSLEDQREKEIIKEKVEEEVYNLINGTTSSEDVRSLIKNNMESIEKIVNDYKVDYKINYGYNYFPVKNYKGVLYPAGNYESLVITLGEGIGDNFWCVLFPPLCLMENNKEDVGEVEYRSFVKDLLDKF